MKLIDPDELLCKLIVPFSEYNPQILQTVTDAINDTPTIDTERGDAISREWLLKKFNVREAHEITRFGYVATVVYHAPTIEPERPHGEWLHPYEINIACECSNCGMQMPITDYFNFCPNCGADMKGGAE